MNERPRNKVHGKFIHVMRWVKSVITKERLAARARDVARKFALSSKCRLAWQTRIVLEAARCAGVR